MVAAAPNGDQFRPPSDVKNAPMSVPTYSVLWVASSGSITKAFTGMSGNFVAVPLMSAQVVAAPAVPLMVLKTWPVGPEQKVVHVPNPENVA